MKPPTAKDEVNKDKINAVREEYLFARGRHRGRFRNSDYKQRSQVERILDEVSVGIEIIDRAFSELREVESEIKQEGYKKRIQNRNVKLI